MHTRHCLSLADRIHAMLLREIGQGLDRQRLLREPLYARDVLLVCDALPQSGLPALAQKFRQALEALEQADAADAAASRQGFSASRFFNSIFGQPAPIAMAKASRYGTKAAGPVRLAHEKTV